MNTLSMKRTFPEGFYFITDRKTSEKYNSEIIADCVIALENGVKIIQYREKERTKLGDAYILETAQKIRALCKEKNALFIMNDYIDLAKAVDADGVHLGQTDESIQTARQVLDRDKIIGVTCPSLEHALAAEQQGADYLGVGSIYATATKQHATIIGIETLKKIREEIRIPIVAIGGITFQNVQEVLPYCDNLVMIAGIYGGASLAENVRRVCNMFTERK